MEGNSKTETLLQFTKHFSDTETCKKYLAKARWKGKPTCPHCRHEKIYHFSDGLRYKCASCKKQFNSIKGSVLEDSKIDLPRWFLAIYIVVNHKKGISSYQLAKDLGVTQKTAWFMLHRIRYIISHNTYEKHKLKGIVELDETYVGGKNKNRHFDKKVKHSQGRSYKDKVPVFGLIQRGGLLKAHVIKDVTGKTLKQSVYKHVAKGATLMTDEWKSYRGLSKRYNHQIVEHGKGQYVKDNCYTNTLEGFWSLMKRGITGEYHKVSKKHLDKYVQEFVFRYNYRKAKNSDRFNLFVDSINSTLSYKELTRSQAA